MNAIALLKISPAVVRSALASEDGGASVAANGEACRIDPLEDAVALHLVLPLASEREVLAARVVALAGELAALHDDARGVAVFPDTMRLSAVRYDAAVEELGELADWVALPAAAPPDMDQLLAALGPQGDGMAQMISSLGADPAALMASAQAIAQDLQASGMLAGMMEQLRGGALDLGALTAHAQAMIEKDPDLARRLGEAFGDAPAEGGEGSGDDEG